MSTHFTFLDWSVVGAYLSVLVITGILFTRHEARNAKDYFLAGRQIRPWLAAVSVLATTQSAATFLGAPEYGYRGDYTYLSTYGGALLAAVFVAKVLIPRFYALGVTTVYELLASRFDRRAMRAAGAMYLIGRVLAGGSRVYLAAIALSMMLFADVSAQGILLSSLALMVAGFLFTFFGGLKSIIWSDLIQFVIYVAAAVAVLIFLWTLIPAPAGEIYYGLAATPEGHNKLKLLNFSSDLGEPFAVFAVLTGVFLLYAGNFGLDQDTMQRLLACKDSADGARALYMSVFAAVPIIWVFISIGSLLYIFYDRPDLMNQAAGTASPGVPGSADTTIFMHFILTQIPPGLRGCVTVGVIAAAVSTINSGLNSMSSVLIQDFYRPWKSARSQPSDAHFVQAGRVGMAIFGALLFAMSVLCFYWQRYTESPLLEFVLSVMTFAYAGLLGVYFAAVFTDRGSSRSVIWALAVGFTSNVLMQGYVVDTLGLPAAFGSLSFPWQLCVGTALAFLACVADRRRAVEPDSDGVRVHVRAPNAVPDAAAVRATEV